MDNTEEKRVDKIINELYSSGGRGQCKMFLMQMLDNEDIHPEDILDNISQLLSERKRLLERDCILPISQCDYFLKDGKSYTCLDKELKLCVVEKGTTDWKNVSHVLVKFNPNQALNLINQHKIRTKDD
jgi:hypothetical protein